MTAHRQTQLLKTFLLCTLLVLGLSLFSFHDISPNSELASRTPASTSPTH